MRYLLFLILVFFCISLTAVYQDTNTIIPDTLKKQTVVSQDSTFLDSLSNYVLYNQPPEPIKQVESPSFMWMLVKMIFSLIVITVILYLILRFVKKLNQNQFMNNEKLIKVVESQPIGFKQYIQIVSIHKKLYVISSCANNTQVIDKIEDPVVIEEIINSKTNQKLGDFNKIFSKFKSTKG